VKEISIIKRDGSQETLDIEKIHKCVFWACEELTNVSPSDIEMRSSIQFCNKMKTEDIHEVMVKASADLISEEQPNYTYVAARLRLFDLRKKIFGQFQPIPLHEVVKNNTKRKIYDSTILNAFNDDEWGKLDKIIKHKRDFHFTYAGIEQVIGKYLAQNRVKNTVFETPQIMYIMIAITLFKDYPIDTRLKYIKEAYDSFSKFEISLSTPILAGLRTPQKQFSSCVTIETDDSLDGLIASSGSIVKYVASKAGIGIGAGRIRALGSSIRAGDAYHTGITPFYKYFESSVKSVNQGGVRNASATLHTMIWHYEIEDILVLKNNKGTDDNRVRKLDYSIQICRLFYERLLKNEDITLFSPHEVKDLYEAFFIDQDKFRELYLHYEQKTGIMKKKISAKKLFSLLATERAETGRIYIMNIDHANDHSSFLDPIHMSNLCQEISLPTTPMNNVVDPEGEIGLCTLCAVNLGIIKSLNEFERINEIAVRILDSILSYQDYPVPAAEKATKRRSLGIGFTNLAYFLAKNDVKYSDGRALRLVDEVSEAHQYWLIKASCKLAREFGSCEYFDRTKYSKGILPIDTYNKNVDVLTNGRKYNYDWEALRDEIKESGMRHSTLSCQMPCESSSLVINSTNGIEPPRSFITVKQMKHGVLKQVVPDYIHLKNKYELLWNMKSNTGYHQIVAIMQKYFDQSISCNFNYDPSNYDEGKIPTSEVLKDMLYAYKIGIKNFYYHQTRDLREEVLETSSEDNNDGCAGGACAI